MLSVENSNDFSYDSDEELLNSQVMNDNSDFEEEEHNLQDAKCHDAVIVENVKWENDPISMEQFPFTKSECLLQPKACNDPIEYFKHLFTDDFLDEIVTHTNDYARYVLHDQKTDARSRIKSWKDTTKEEILVFIGLILHMGTIRLTRLQDYWKKDSLFGFRVFGDNMSRDRFYLLLNALQFSKVTEQNSKDRFYKVRGMVNLFNARMAEIYYPGREISLSESMVCFKHYVTNKLNRRNMKFCTITTPDGMVVKCMLDDSDDNQNAHKVVLNLLDGMLDAGHSVFIDNSYCSYELVKCLAGRKIHCTGIIRRKEGIFPPEVREANLKKGETIAKFANGVMIAKWKDSIDVTCVSNEFINDIIVTSNKRGDIRSKPLPIIQYNKYMSSTKKLDHMLLPYYPCERQKIKWPTKVFIHVLQLIISNANFLHNEFSDKNMLLYDFRLSVIRCLLKQVTVTRIPVCDSSKLEHLLEAREEKNGRKMRKQCKRCYSKGKRRFTIYVCNDCDGSPGYCLKCAKITHV
ncbi:hypothetical protein JTE90_022693 [Oedothorax gibbosus]|uniref:PiggyBac transposable element-derived protein domain-containing protein n=1 Tax=Oedothorax gibbosus TaxID=931172 RepID=A0AAV6UKH2_9ARAC|nr:hypothetical protein JTE90_022693 [Oedothorax gibbosus]